MLNVQGKLSNRTVWNKPKSKEAMEGGSTKNQGKSTVGERKIAYTSITIQKDVASMCEVPV